MRFRSLDELERSELIEPKAIDAKMVARWLDRSRQDLELGTEIADSYPVRAMTILYESGLRVCLAFLALRGYRVRSVAGHHRAAIEGARTVLGARLDEVLLRLDRARRFRNESLYGNAPVPGAADVRQAANDVRELIQLLETSIVQ